MSDAAVIDDQIVSAEPGYWLPAHMKSAVTLPVVAGGGPVVPPAEWFQNPNLLRPTPLTITASGQVYGHAATWKTSHIGLAGDVRAPRSRSNYAFFATGAVLTDSGDQVDVGQLTMVGGHAPLNASVERAVAHYDNTKSAMADVAIGEDKHGIWIAGGVRPNVTEEEVRVLRASAISGDWRPINGRLELVAICSVNVPGFPVPRARVASGGSQVLALVAAGVEPLVEARIQEIADESLVAAMDAMSARLAAVESTVFPGGVKTKEEIDAEARAALVASARERVTQRRTERKTSELRARVHKA